MNAPWRRLAPLLLLAAATSAASVPPPDSWEAFVSGRDELLAAASPTAANRLMAMNAEAKNCELVRRLTAAVGACPFVDRDDPSQLRAMDRWSRECGGSELPWEWRQDYDEWYFMSALAEADARGETADEALDRAGALSSEILELTAGAAEEREAAMGPDVSKVFGEKRLNVHALASVADHVSVRRRRPRPEGHGHSGRQALRKWKEDMAELDRLERSGVDPNAGQLGPLMLLSFLREETDPFLLSSAETYRALSAEAAARCTFSRASVRRQEAAWELLAVLSGRSFRAHVERVCRMAPDTGVPEEQKPFSPLVPVEPELCDTAANVVVASLASMTSTRAMQRLLEEYMAPALADLAALAPVLGLKRDPFVPFVELLREQRTLRVSLTQVALSSPADLYAALTRERMDSAAKEWTGEMVYDVMMTALMRQRDLAPARTAVKVLMQVTGSAAEVRWVGVERRELFKSYAAMIREYGPMGAASTYKQLRAKYFLALSQPTVSAVDGTIVEGARRLGSVKLLELPGVRAVAEFFGGLSPGATKRLDLLPALGKAYLFEGNLPNMVRRSLELQAAMAGLNFNVPLPQRFWRMSGAAAFASNTKEALRRYGHAALDSRVMERMATAVQRHVPSARVAVTSLDSAGRAAAAKATGAAVAKLARTAFARLLGPLSLALDAFDAYRYWNWGHRGAAAVKVASAAVAVISMAVMVALPGIGFALLGVSAVIAGSADYWVHTRKRHASDMLATALGFTPGADSGAELAFVEGSTCKALAEERVAPLQSVVAGLVDGWTTERYEEAVVRVFRCLTDEGQCKKARDICAHGSEELSGGSLLWQVDGAEDRSLFENLARCGVDVGADSSSEALRYARKLRCRELAALDQLDHVTTVAKELAEAKSVTHASRLMWMLSCLNNSGKPSATLAIARGVGRIKLRRGMPTDRYRQWLDLALRRAAAEVRGSVGA